MKHLTSYLLLILTILSFSFSPMQVFAQAAASDPTNTQANGELIPCGNDYNRDGVVNGTEQCGFTGLILLINNIITWLIKMSTVLATAVFAYAGISLMISGGNPAAMTKFKGMLWKVLTGYIIIFIAWISVYTIVNALVDPNGSLDFIGALKK